MNTTHDASHDSLATDTGASVLTLEARTFASMSARANAARRTVVTTRLTMHAGEGMRAMKPVHRLLAIR